MGGIPSRLICEERCTVIFVLSQIQTELTCQRIQELETQASSDLEIRNNRIEELTRNNEDLKHQVQTQSKVCNEPLII